MIISSIDVSVILMSIQRLFSNMDPAYADMVKMLTGTTAWIGGLTWFMWAREKKKNRHGVNSHVA